MSQATEEKNDPYRYWKVLPNTLDSHCHLKTMARRQLPLDSLLPRFFREGGRLLLDIGTDETGWEERRLYSRTHPGRIFHTAGIHPTSLAPDPSLQLQAVEKQIQDPSVLAWGEIGLDYYHTNVEPGHQKEWFIRQLEAADKAEKPVILHNREADDDLFAILEEHPPRYGGILHCFSSGPKEAERALNLGLLLGINGNSTYKDSGPIREAVRRTPPASLVPDTDSPFLSPIPARGRPNHPGHIHLIYQLIAELHGITPEEAASTALDAFLNLFPSARAS